MTLKEYKEIRTKYDKEEIYKQQMDRFFEEHPECPEVKPIERLSLVMKKEYALDIIAGKKNIEVRDADSKKYQDMLYDKDMLAYEEKHWDDELMRLQLIDFTSNVRPVLSIHFYTYNNSWSMDVECTANGIMQVTDEQVESIHQAFGSDEFDELLEDLNKDNVPDEARPYFFYFAIGKILERRNI